MISKDLLLIPGENKISIININEYSLIRTIDVPNSNLIACTCMLNENILLTGDYNGLIKQWNIEGDNLILVSTKESSQKNSIYSLIKIGDGHIASGSSNKLIKIW